MRWGWWVQGTEQYLCFGFWVTLAVLTPHISLLRDQIWIGCMQGSVFEVVLFIDFFFFLDTFSRALDLTPGSVLKDHKDDWAYLVSYI